MQPDFQSRRVDVRNRPARPAILINDGGPYALVEIAVLHKAPCQSSVPRDDGIEILGFRQPDMRLRHRHAPARPAAHQTGGFPRPRTVIGVELSNDGIEIRQAEGGFDALYKLCRHRFRAWCGIGWRITRRQFLDNPLEPVLRNQMGRHATLAHGVRVDHHARHAQHHAEMVRHSRQMPGAADIREEADPDLRHREPGGRRDDARRTLRRQPIAAAHDDAVDQRDERFRIMEKGSIEPIFVLEEACRPQPAVPRGLDIAAGAEGPVARAGENDAPYPVILTPVFKNIRDAPDHGP